MLPNADFPAVAVPDFSARVTAAGATPANSPMDLQALACQQSPLPPGTLWATPLFLKTACQQ